MRNTCRECGGPVIEIERYGHELMGCVRCNLWKWRDSHTDRVLLQLPSEDLQDLSVGLTTRRTRLAD